MAEYKSSYTGSEIDASIAKVVNNEGVMDTSNPTGTGKVQINGTVKGEKAVAIGDKATAYGDNSFAEGVSDHLYSDYCTDQEVDDVVTSANKSTRTSQDNTTIETFINKWDYNDGAQKFAIAAGKFAKIEGANGLALAKGSHAEGNGCVAVGKASHSEGTGSRALGHYSHAGGLETVANGIYSFAQGFRVRANGDSAISLGRGENTNGYSANGYCAITMGEDAIANADNAVAIGNNVLADRKGQIVLGKYNSSGNYLFAIGNGTADSRANAFIVDYNNNAKFYGDIEGSGALSINRKLNTSIGQYSSSMGYNTTASNGGSHAEGWNTTSSGENGSHAEGWSTKATARAAHAEGVLTEASGLHSHAEGVSTKASGYQSHSEGEYTTASGARTHAEGYYTLATSDNQHVQGKYNVEDTQGKYAHIVGNGSDNSRSNAHTLDWDGNAWYAGSVEAINGIIIKSPNNTRYKITVDNSGNLSTTVVS